MSLGRRSISMALIGRVKTRQKRRYDMSKQAFQCKRLRAISQDSGSQVQQKPQSSLLSILDEWEWIIAPIIFTALAFFTRMWKIGLSPIVTWDEAQ